MIARQPRLPLKLSLAGAALLLLASPLAAAASQRGVARHPKLDRSLQRAAELGGGESRVIIELTDDAPVGLLRALGGVGGQKVAPLVDFVNHRRLPYDDNGHGTHVAGIIAGSGDDSYGARAGIAPGVHLVSLKVLDAQSAGHISDVIGALDWVVEHRAAYNVRVINLSAGASVTESSLTDPLTLVARRVVAGIVVAAATRATAVFDPATGTVIETTTTCAATTEGGF